MYIYTLGITQCVLDLCTAAHCNSPRVCWHIWLFLVTVANRHDPDPNWVNTGQSYINGDKVLTTDDEPSLSLEVDSCTNNLISFFFNIKKNYECFLLVTVRARSLPTFHNKAIPINLTQKMSPLSTHLLLQLVPHLLMWKWHMHPTVRVTWELT